MRKAPDGQADSLPANTKIVDRWYLSFDEDMLDFVRCRQMIRLIQYIERTDHSEQLTGLSGISLVGINRDTGRRVVSAKIASATVSDNKYLASFFSGNHGEIICFASPDDGCCYYVDYRDLNPALSFSHY